MRKPSEYIAAAIRGIRDRVMQECIMTMRCGDCEADVTRVGTASKGEDSVNESGPIEAVRVLALAPDFPRIVKDDVAYLGDDMHIVTSVRVDPSKTSMMVGMTESLSKCAASVSGVRGVRRLSMPIELLARDNGLATDYTDGLAPVVVHSWVIVIPRDAWSDSTDPEIGDEIMIGEDRLMVSRVVGKDGYFMLTARSRG